ncbi:unnamed protein product, partial [Amoebophrya sp. A25]
PVFRRALGTGLLNYFAGQAGTPTPGVIVKHSEAEVVSPRGSSNTTQAGVQIKMSTALTVIGNNEDTVAKVERAFPATGMSNAQNQALLAAIIAVLTLPNTLQDIVDGFTHAGHGGQATLFADALAAYNAAGGAVGGASFPIDVTSADGQGAPVTTTTTSTTTVDPSFSRVLGFQLANLPNGADVHALL